MKPKSLMIALVAILATLALAGPATAQSNVPYVAYITAPGDRLAKLAREFCTTWNEIYDLNRGAIGPDANVLFPGTQLIIPNRCGLPGSPPPASGGNVYDRGPRMHANGTVLGNVYTVAWGDSLYSVSQRFGVSMSELAAINGLSSANKIYGGQKLIIPGLTPGRPPVTVPPPGVQPSTIAITSPAPGTFLGSSFIVSGTGTNLPEGNVVVNVKDGNGLVIAQQATVLQGYDVGLGGAGVWSVQFDNVIQQPQSNGAIEAYSPGTGASAGISIWFR